MESSEIVNVTRLIPGILLPWLHQTERQVLDEIARNQAGGSFVRLSDGMTHYEDSGAPDDPPVILVHGYSVPYYMWDRVVTPLNRGGFRVIRYDLYGRGFSDRPKLRYDRALFLRQLRELLAELSLKPPVHLVGTSMGGAIVAAFAADFPELVAKIVLLDPLWEPLPIGPLAIPGIGECVAAGFYVPATPKKQYQDFYRPELFFPEWELKFREQMRYKGFSHALLSTARHFLSRDPKADFQKMASHHQRVLQIWGSEDRTLRKEGAHKLQALLGSELSWIEAAGHLPHYEKPEIVNQALLRFLTDSDPIGKARHRSLSSRSNFFSSNVRKGKHLSP
ncbi:pimeloyl-ACP methyl ester carboxylesterase [Hydrogenispora ethanolica]|uniref:Pimeloyl-ACP methyl ester carboxylesterase n=1 Tax=Hydrogenispora ethanolica TaxID=1082276 RepID=A0A4R1QXH6_HYDET|nr:alpha/beta hydrolase [Hydrogenispora ethanolica]TCL56474.1 pimeloyl-ACP methyl ester carboxylesterase [Hydrogenispora ethanolica]